MSDSTDDAVDCLAARQEVRQRVVQLYRTTSLTSGAIAAEVGVSRKTVYRWLREAGVALGRNANNHQAALATGEASMVGDELAELRRAVTVVIGQLDRLEGLVGALVDRGPIAPRTPLPDTDLP